MNLVVTFLSMLGQEAEQGGVHRMLGICSEFERIAKVVIEKAEKDQASRRKRKNMESTKSSTAPGNDAARRTASIASSNYASGPAPAPTATSTSNSASPQATTGAAHNAPMRDHLTPTSWSDRGPSHSPITIPNGETSPALGSAGWPQEFPVPQNGDFESFNNMNGFQGISSPPTNGGGPVHQPLLPQDLFSLPMTLDWNWAEMSGGAYPTVENGNFGGRPM